VSQVWTVSQACSCMMPLSKKMEAALRMPVMRSSQVEEPLVCGKEKVSFEGGERGAR